MQLAAVQKMATQYDCHDASGDVVTTLQNIVRKNDAEGNRLAAECEGFKTTYATAWTAAKAKYDTEFPQVAIDANAAYDAATIAKNTAYTTATTALETRFNDVKAEWQTTEPLGTRISAVKTPMTTATTTHDTAVASEATALANKIAAIGTIAEDGVDGTATIQKATSLGVCNTLLNERQAHISSDVDLLDKMEPLLKQLKICEGSAHEATGQSNSKLLSLVEVDTRAKCALIRKSMTSLLEVSGVPTGSFADFKARVITETTYMNKEKTTCDGEANTAYTNVVTHHTSLWNAAKTLTEEKLAIKTSATAAYNAEVEIGEDRMRSATTAKTSEEATRDEAKTAAEILATNTKSTAITTGEAAVTLTKAEAKTSIGNDARFQANLCTEGKENLLAEAALVRQMTDILNSGGTDGSDLRVVGDDVDGNVVNMNKYYITELNENCRVTGNVIRSKAECKIALTAVGKSDRFVWNSVHRGIPGGCSVRGHADGHYDNRGLSGTVGEKRGDLRAVCKGSKTGDVGITGQDTMATAADFGTVSEELAATTDAADTCPANVDGDCRQVPGNGPHAVKVCNNGIRIIQHTKLSDRRFTANEQKYKCTGYASGGWGVHQAHNHDCTATSPETATESKMWTNTGHTYGRFLSCH